MSVKIIDLQAENAPTDDDLLIIRDNASGITKKITRANLFINPPIPTSAITTLMLADGSVTKSKLDVNAKLPVRTYSVTSPSTLTANVDNYEIFAVTALGTNMTVAAPTGTPVDGQGIMYRFVDNGTVRSIAWDAIFRAMGITLPTSTTAGNMIYVNARWNAPAQKWDVVGVGRQ